MSKIAEVVTRMFVLGREAESVFKIADFDADPCLMEATVIGMAKMGITIGINPRNPVNKKEHIAEAQALVDSLNADFAKTEEPARLDVLNARISQMQEHRNTENRTAYQAGIKELNALLKERDNLILEIGRQAALSVPPAVFATARERWAEQVGSVIIHKEITDYSKYAKNAAFKMVADNLEVVKDNALAAQKSMDIIVHQVMPFPVDRQGRIGQIIFQVPTGLMEVKQWNNTSHAFEWLAMEQYDYNGFNRSNARLTYGSGFLKLAIKQNDQGVFISWPKTKGKDDQFYDVFKTVDVRYMVHHTDNNHNVQAALGAFVQTLWAEMKQANPRNRHGFKEHCGNCRHMLYLPIHEQTGEDYENKANPVDTSELGQWGSRIPQWICTVNKVFTDKEAIDDLNEATSYEVNSYIGEDGNIKYLRAGEVLIKGKPVHTYKIRAEGTEDTCARCPFYLKNEKKPDDRVAMEMRQAIERGIPKPYIAKYWTERATIERMPVFTLHNDEGTPKWDLGYPGDFSSPLSFCVQGVGGINIYGTDLVMKLVTDTYQDNQGVSHRYPVATFVASTEAYRKEEAQVAKLINIIHTVCNQFVGIAPETFVALTNMILGTPRPMKEPMATRYTRAMKRFTDLVNGAESEEQVEL